MGSNNWRGTLSGVISEIEATGTTELSDGSRVPLHSHIPPGGGELIRRSIAATKPKLGIEVGLAFGISTLYILDAMQQHGGGKLIGMDPAQHDHTWRGGGLHNVRRAGFAENYEFWEQTSQNILPRLSASGARIQFAFLDGWHTFDHTLIDFFYADAMLDVGGIIVVDDTGYPAIGRLCDFVLANRDYSVFGIDSQLRSPSLRVKIKRAAQALLHPIVRDDLTPDHLVVRRQSAARNSTSIALQKRGNDSRRFDHFVPF
jgi:predicted O-methyltransferase YrrM